LFLFIFNQKKIIFTIIYFIGALPFSDAGTHSGSCMSSCTPAFSDLMRWGAVQRSRARCAGMS
jgi:hypothetical protein